LLRIHRLGFARRDAEIGPGHRQGQPRVPRLVPLPKDFGQVFGFWLSDRGRDDFVFAKEPGGKAPGPHAGGGWEGAGRRQGGRGSGDEDRASAAPAEQRPGGGLGWRVRKVRRVAAASRTGHRGQIQYFMPVFSCHIGSCSQPAGKSIAPTGIACRASPEIAWDRSRSGVLALHRRVKVAFLDPRKGRLYG
jgi:hypothetical protein